MDEQLSQALQKVIRFLETNGLQYAVVGGIALSSWNVSRFTHDIDIKLLVPNAEYGSLRQLLRQTFPLKAREHAPENALIVAVSVDDIVIDFLLALPGYEEMIITRSVQQDLGEFSIRVCTAEDLVIQKVVAGREKDWPDVEALLIEQWVALDHNYIEGWLSQFAEALESPELLARYQIVQDKVQQMLA
ncbi:MAG TPA: nucleotidyl transferase AbiEii/AbiGii toxin family protein [Anaerolineae bacterium]|nr:nucleotidyl transferase AbiEii/AbiGii toxin family protein [Anaerolineae bacterium]